MLLEKKYDKEFDLSLSYHVIYVCECIFKYSMDLYRTCMYISIMLISLAID